MNRYMAFDKVAKKHAVFKVETVGDAYMGTFSLFANRSVVPCHCGLTSTFVVNKYRRL